jgi:hypothetical protein
VEVNVPAAKLFLIIEQLMGLISFHNASQCVGISTFVVAGTPAVKE